MPSFHIRIADADLTFSAGHFITLDSGLCERLHGHTYHVSVEIAGSLNDNQVVVDFLFVREMLKRILSTLDHRMLLPTRHPTIRVAVNAGEVEAVFQERRWSFPEDDCLLLPIANTTTELLACYVGEQLLAEFSHRGLASPSRVSVAIDEGDGATAVCQWP